MKIMGGLLVASLAAAFFALAMPAKAQDVNMPEIKAGKWTGCHVGLHVGWSRSGTRGKLDTAAGPIPGVRIASDREDAAIGGVNAGCDVQLGRMVVGGAGDWTAGSADVANAVVIGGMPLADATFKVRDSYALVGRVGFLVHDDVLVYVLGGHTWANTSGLSLSAPGGSVSFAMPDMAGWTLGAGAEWQPKALGGFVMKIEYRFTDFARENVELLPAVKLGNDHIDHSVRLGVSYRFGAGQ